MVWTQFKKEIHNKIFYLNMYIRIDFAPNIWAIVCGVKCKSFSQIYVFSGRLHNLTVFTQLESCGNNIYIQIFFSFKKKICLTYSPSMKYWWKNNFIMQQLEFFWNVLLFSHYFMIFKRKEKCFMEIRLVNSQHVRSAYNS